MDLHELAGDFARAMKACDADHPQAQSGRSKRVYRPGIGPFSEDRAVDLVVAELKRTMPERYSGLRCRVPYPASRRKCDLVLGDPAIWAVEIKMARFSGDNGKPDDTAIKDLLSPFDADRSAVADCVKLAGSTIAPNRAILVYGFDDDQRPLNIALAAFEVLAGRRVTLGPRYSFSFADLVHPVFKSGQVCAWSLEL